MPLAQAMHAATSDDAEYVPCAQGVQLVAPAAAPVSVKDPAGHSVHVSGSVALVPKYPGLHSQTRSTVASPSLFVWALVAHVRLSSH